MREGGRERVSEPQVYEGARARFIKVNVTVM